MFELGTDGFHLYIKKASVEKKRNGRKLAMAAEAADATLESTKEVSAMEFYSYRLMVRDGMNVTLRCCRLTQQYIVDAAAKMEQERLNFVVTSTAAWKIPCWLMM